MPACKSVSMYSKIRYMSLSFSALRTFNNLPSVQSIERSLEWVPLSVCGNNKWHLMIFSWLLTSCKNIISRKVRCFQKLQQQGELSPWMQQRQQSIPERPWHSEMHRISFSEQLYRVSSCQPISTRRHTPVKCSLCGVESRHLRKLRFTPFPSFCWTSYLRRTCLSISSPIFVQGARNSQPAFDFVWAKRLDALKITFICLLLLGPY